MSWQFASYGKPMSRTVWLCGVGGVYGGGGPRAAACRADNWSGDNLVRHVSSADSTSCACSCCVDSESDTSKEAWQCGHVSAATRGMKMILVPCEVCLCSPKHCNFLPETDGVLPRIDVVQERQPTGILIDGKDSTGVHGKGHIEIRLSNVCVLMLPISVRGRTL